MKNQLKIVFLSLGLTCISFTPSSASNFTYELVDPHERAMHLFDKARTIAGEALEKHGISTINISGKADFTNLDVDIEEAEISDVKRTAIHDAVKGYVFLRNLESCYLETREYLEKAAKTHPLIDQQ